MLKKLRVYKFFNQVKQEAKKVAWPKRGELMPLFIMVLVVMLIFSVVTLIVDYGIHSMINFLLNIGK